MTKEEKGEDDIEMKENNNETKTIQILNFVDKILFFFFHDLSVLV